MVAGTPKMCPFSSSHNARGTGMSVAASARRVWCSLNALRSGRRTHSRGNHRRKISHSRRPPPTSTRMACVDVVCPPCSCRTPTTRAFGTALPDAKAIASPGRRVGEPGSRSVRARYRFANGLAFQGSTFRQPIERIGSNTVEPREGLKIAPVGVNHEPTRTVGAWRIVREDDAPVGKPHVW